MNQFIIINDLNFKYAENGFKLENINLELEKGKIISLIGPNGAGKTTIGKILSGIIDNYTGRIFIEGKDLKKLNFKEKARKIAYVPQVFNTIFDFEIKEILLMGRRNNSNGIGFMKKIDIDIVEETMRDFGLYEKKNKKFSTLSGGEKRMVLIARAICQGADFIILDEPVAYLDLHHYVDLINILLKLNKSGKTIFLILHDINMASEISDEIILLNRGKIIKKDIPENIINEDIIKNFYGIKNFIIKNNPVTFRPNVIIMPHK